MSDIKKCRADWMSGAHGMMVHYLPPALYAKDGRTVDPLRMADEFDIEVFMDGFLSTGSRWLIFTAGQNFGIYNSPNSAITKYAGNGHCSGRDLLLELATAVKSVGRHFIVYLPCEIRGNKTLHEGFGWTNGADPAENVFQDRWLEVISCWAKRLGPLLDGWWFDGAYSGDVPLPASAIRLDEWYSAARSGNPDAAVTFNDGCYCGGKSEPHLAGMDYYAGEAEALHDGAVRYTRNWQLPVWYPNGKFCTDGTTLRHVLLPIDAFWWHAPETDGCDFAGSPFQRTATVKKTEMEKPMYEAAYLREFRDSWCGLGAAVTFNVGVFMNGSMGDDTLRLFAEMGKCHGCH